MRSCPYQPRVLSCILVTSIGGFSQSQAQRARSKATLRPETSTRRGKKPHSSRGEKQGGGPEITKKLLRWKNQIFWKSSGAWFFSLFIYGWAVELHICTLWTWSFLTHPRIEVTLYTGWKIPYPTRFLYASLDPSSPPPLILLGNAIT